MPPTIRIIEPLGMAYGATLVPIESSPETWLRDIDSGETFPVQAVPALAFDAATDASLVLACMSLAPRQQRVCETIPSPRSVATPFRVRHDTDCLEIANEGRALRFDAQGTGAAAYPLRAWSIDAGRTWLETQSGSSGFTVSESIVCDAAVESEGPCCLQWRIEMRQATRPLATLRMRWPAGCDTILVEETIHADSDHALRFDPFGATGTEAFAYGGGEDTLPMRRLTHEEGHAWFAGTPGLLARLAHISYHNQWNLGWCELRKSKATSAFGIFTGWGGSWRRRGMVRIDVRQQETGSAYLRFPLRRGRRLYGLVLAPGPDGAGESERCRCNRRKAQWADLPVTKTHHWQLDGALPERKARLLDADEWNARCRSLTKVPAIESALRARLDTPSNHSADLAAAFSLDDAEAIQTYAPLTVTRLEACVATVIVGGYEALTIFAGRKAKALAYDVDALWSTGFLSPEEYRRARTALLTMAYILADPDYFQPLDFRPHDDPESGMADALGPEMGPCPVPPNFASEHISTVGLVAELYSQHSEHERWRAWSLHETQHFLETWFEHDGTYRESINYHSHALSELCCLFHAWRLHGVWNAFENARVRGSYRHFVEMLTPPLLNAIAPLESLAAGAGAEAVVVDWDAKTTAVWPPIGNSGSDARGMRVRDDLPIAASMYRDADPPLASALMWAWRASGRPLLMHEHPLLTLTTLDPFLPEASPVCSSSWRHSLGLISRFSDAQDHVGYCLVRAGRATHHMDFDQGGLFLAYAERVLLGDYGYHARDTDGSPLAVGATWLHNAVTYGSDRHLASGYTGLEEAPEPLCVHTGDAFDWVVHRIVNNNLRNLCHGSYRDLLPATTVVHTRHVLVLKVIRAIFVWDTFNQIPDRTTWWWHPTQSVTSVRPGVYRAGEADAPHLEMHILAPKLVHVVESCWRGALFSFSVRGESLSDGAFLLLPQVENRDIVSVWKPADRLLTLYERHRKIRVRFAPAGCPSLPDVIC